MRRRLAWLALAAALLPAAALAQGDSERLRNAKALFFDQKYDKAREEWQAVRAAGRGPEAQAALYWIARCSESLGERERALAEYGEYLASRPADPTLAQEAKTGRIGLAVKLAQVGHPGHLAIASAGLSDPDKVVRYFAALRLASLGPEQGKPAVPVLKEILAKETDQDLVERAKLNLLRLDRSALATSPPPPPPRNGHRQAGWIRVRVYDRGSSRPTLALNVPIALAELVFKSLPEDARDELRRKGYDSASFWERVKKTGPTDILTIEGEDGERVQVWIE
ncbi:MAG TPA: HEAT repeat domain-containing protein [Vicinamibacteria bacterium]|nr:HEAT repeat domain-containing protein [Vicinamibacteria bacterium]